MRNRLFMISSLLLMLGSIPSLAQLLPSPSTPDNSSMPKWTEVFPGTNPIARDNSAMVYDAAAGKVVLFAGIGGPDAEYLSGTFLWNGHDWTQEHPKSHPSPRSWHSMAYDGGAKNVILFGGFDGGFLQDTWVWNGSDWTQEHPKIVPSARDTSAMAYDSSENKVVLFGGYQESGTVNDTWVWSGTNWRAEHPSHAPSARQPTPWRTIRRRATSCCSEAPSSTPIS